MFHKGCCYGSLFRGNLKLASLVSPHTTNNGPHCERVVERRCMIWFVVCRTENKCNGSMITPVISTPNKYLSSTHNRWLTNIVMPSNALVSTWIVVFSPTSCCKLGSHPSGSENVSVLYIGTTDG